MPNMRQRNDTRISKSREFYRLLKDALRRGLLDHGISGDTATASIDKAIIATAGDYCGVIYFPQKLTLDVLTIAPIEASQPAPKPQRIPYFDDSTSGDFYAGLFDCIHDGLTSAGIAASLADSQTDSVIIALIDAHGGNVVYFPQDYQPLINHTMSQLTERVTA